MKYCKKCILPETYPGISFDAEGICNFCKAYKPQKDQLRKEKLVELLGSVKSKGKYDCVVPMSGGKDSSFILYFAVKELGLNPLVVSYDSGYQDEIARENIRKACELLDVDYHVIHSPGNIQRRLLKKNYKLSQRYHIYLDGCMSCEAILRVVTMNAARAHHIPFVLWGSSALEGFGANKITAIESSGAGEGLQGKDKRTFLQQLITVIKKPIKILRHIPYYFYNILQRVLLKFPLKYAFVPGSTPPLSKENPQFVPFFDYIQWDSISNVSVLKEELDWAHPEGKDIRFDCRLHSIGNYNRLHSCGISSDGVNFCNMIREQKMIREEAAMREAEIAGTVDEEYQALLEEILS